MDIKAIQIPNEKDQVHESFRTLRTNILYSYEAHTITVTSFSPDEGKTVTAFNLALAFSKLGKKTLLIDGDLKRSSLTSFFGVSKKLVGLSEYLTNQSELVVRPTTENNLFVLLGGSVPPNSTELLSSQTFTDLLDNLKRIYDYIIIDTPPYTVTNDGLIISLQCDGTIFSVRNEVTRKKNIHRLKEIYTRSDTKIIGMALTRVKKNSMNYGYYERYKYYYKNYYKNY